MDYGEILRRHGFGFKKKFGQNFLSDENLLAAIVRDAEVEGETAVEIGAGAGALTRALAASASRVVAFEIDRSLAPVLSETLMGCENVEVRFSDFMKCNLAALEEELGSYSVVANLPYYVTTPLVMRLVEEGKNCRSATVMVQEEVALRLCAKAGTADYGAVTCAIARRGTATIVRKVPRTLFYPRPNVDSAVVRLDFTKGGFAADAKKYRAVVRAAFAARRKTLENAMMNAFRLSREEAADLLARADIPKGVRGEALSPEQFARIAELL